MAEIDTSSYLKPAALPVQKSALDQAAQYQQLESNRLTISKQQLDQVNSQFGLMNQELSTLANDPSITKEKAEQRLTTFAKTYGFKPEVTNHMLEELNASPNVQSFAKNALVRGMQTQEKVNNLYGTPGFYRNGQQDQATITSPMIADGRPIATDKPYQQQISPSQPTVDAEGRPTLQGPTPPVTPQGTAAGPSPLLPMRQVPTQAIRPSVPQQQTTLPVAPRSDTGLTPQSTSVSDVMTNRYPAPSGPIVGMSPMFEEGKKAYTQDQENAAQKMIGVQPAIQALQLMKTPGFNSGPGTKAFNNVLATAKTWGLVDQSENDPTVAYQEITKKLADYVSRSPVGQRSDAAQTLKEAASPNPSVQILPALKKLTEDAIALDRMEAARPGAFKNKNFEEYPNHRSLFPQSMDYRAFKLDQMGDNGPKLVNEMDAKLKKNPKDAEALKFFKSLDIAQKYYQ